MAILNKKSPNTRSIRVGHVTEQPNILSTTLVTPEFILSNILLF